MKRIFSRSTSAPRYEREVPAWQMAVLGFVVVALALAVIMGLLWLGVLVLDFLNRLIA